MINCLKRSVTCELYDKAGILLSTGFNYCSPKDNVCQRIGVVQDSSDYTNDCNSIHAEVDAINNLPVNSNPYKAVLQGHTFFCNNCMEKLKESGVTIFAIK